MFLYYCRYLYLINCGFFVGNMLGKAPFVSKENLVLNFDNLVQVGCNFDFADGN